MAIRTAACRRASVTWSPAAGTALTSTCGEQGAGAAPSLRRRNQAQQSWAREKYRAQLQSPSAPGAGPDSSVPAFTRPMKERPEASGEPVGLGDTGSALTGALAGVNGGSASRAAVMPAYTTSSVRLATVPNPGAIQGGAGEAA